MVKEEITMIRSIYDIIELYNDLGFNVTYEEPNKKAEKEESNNEEANL